MTRFPRIFLNALLATLFLFLCGCAALAPKATETPAPPVTPTQTPLPPEIVVQLDQLDAACITGYEYHDNDGKIYRSSDGSILSIDQMGVITAHNVEENSLSWWDSTTETWKIIDAQNPDTFPTLYLDLWNSLLTREPVSVPTLEDLAFTDFEIKAYQVYYSSIASQLNSESSEGYALWKTFFEANGSDFNLMSGDQIYQAWLLYGETSHEVMTPIVGNIQEAQMDLNNYKLNDETVDGTGIAMYDHLTNDQRLEIINAYRSQPDQWQHDEDLLGLTLNIKFPPLANLTGVVKTLFRLPGIDPDKQVGVIMEYNNGQCRLAFTVHFGDSVNEPGETMLIQYEGPQQPIMSRFDKRNGYNPSVTYTIHSLTNQSDQPVMLSDLQEMLGTQKNFFGGPKSTRANACILPGEGIIFLNSVR